MRLQEQHTRAVPLCLELGHRDGPCLRPSSLSTTDYYDNATPTRRPNLTNTNHDGETLCASPGMQSLSVVVPAPSRTHLVVLRRRRLTEYICSGGLGGGSALLADGGRRRRSRSITALCGHGFASNVGTRAWDHCGAAREQFRHQTSCAPSQAPPAREGELSRRASPTKVFFVWRCSRKSRRAGDSRANPRTPGA